jgi:dinuclear metal center YbgI/SA1388 family protein
MFVKNIMETLETVAPTHLQESYDNAGLIVGRPDWPLSGVLFCLDATEEVIAEAVRKKCNMVVSHHPIVFKGLKRFNESNYVERAVMMAIRNNIALYAIHTNLDNVLHRGVNDRIARQLGLVEVEILAPKPGGTPETGAGVTGYLPNPIDEISFLRLIKERMKAGAVRYTALMNRPVSKVAICGGSGSFLLADAIRAKADVFITADFKYHEFFDAEGKIVIADIGHYESEQYTIDLLFGIISENFPNFALHLTDCNTNPIKYL